MTQVNVPVELTVKESSKLNTAIAKELSYEDNKDLFLHFIGKGVKSSGCA